MALTPEQKKLLITGVVAHEVGRRSADGKTLGDKYAERYAAMTKEERYEATHKGWPVLLGIAALVGAFAASPLLGCALLIVPVILVMYVLFIVSAPFMLFFWTAGLFVPTILFFALWREYRAQICVLVDWGFSWMLGMRASDDKVFLRFILGVGLCAAQIPYGIFWILFIPR